MSFSHPAWLAAGLLACLCLAWMWWRYDARQQAALGGGRVLNATSGQGLLYALEQLPVQAGTRVPMVLNIAARSVSGPLDIRGDHSDIY